MKDHIVPPPVLDEIGAAEASPEQRAAAPVDRREFFRLIGLAAVPLVVQGCLSEEGDNWDQSTQLREVNPELERSVTVRKSKDEQSIKTKSEHLSIDEDDFEGFLQVGDQCRIVRNNGNVALYTVGEHRSEETENRVRMGKRARKRLGTSNTFSATLYTKVVAEGLDPDQAKAQSEFIESLDDDDVYDKLVVLAPHGGWIEVRTDHQAEELQALFDSEIDETVSSWICRGYKQGGGAYDQWHITSTDVSPRSFPGLDKLNNRGFKYAVSFHGLSDDDLIIVGGGAPENVRNSIRGAIEDALESTAPEIVVTLATGAEPHSGDSVKNVVNWLTKDIEGNGGEGGIQISSSKSVRTNMGHREAINQAIVLVLGPLLNGSD